MNLALIVGLCSMLLAGLAGAAESTEQDWKTYRSEKFGFEIAYPAGMEFKAYVDGASASLKDAGTGRPLAEFEVWPSGECPRQPPDTNVRTLGIDRAKTVTQTDGPDGSSFCGDPVTVRESASLYGAKIYELELTCMRETFPGSHDDTDEAEPKDTMVETEPIVTEEGKKGPTYFADISPSWKKVILSADPVGVDPRIGPTRELFDPAVLRRILGTLKTFPIRKPSAICIEELQNRGLTIGIPSRRSTSGNVSP
ncbi:MAG: hypothetical protein ACYDAA_06530 [Syntrophales bacterium]